MLTRSGVVALPWHGALRPSGIVAIGGRPLRYRVDRRRPWSYLAAPHADVGRFTGREIALPDVGQVADEYEVATPWGCLRALLWNLDAGLDLVLGRQVLGGASPSPWRPLFLLDNVNIGAGAPQCAGDVPGPMQAEGVGEEQFGRVVNFPVKVR